MIWSSDLFYEIILCCMMAADVIMTTLQAEEVSSHIQNCTRAELLALNIHFLVVNPLILFQFLALFKLVCEF